MGAQVQLPDHLGPEHGRDVGGGRGPAAGGNLLGDVASPTTSRRSSTSVDRPARASSAPAVSPLCPAPTTMTSHRVPACGGVSISDFQSVKDGDRAESMFRLAGKCQYCTLT